MSLEDSLAEGSRNIQVVPRLGDVTIFPKRRFVSRIQEAVDGRRRCRWYGEAVSRASLQDDVLRRRGKAVLYPLLSFLFAL